MSLAATSERSLPLEAPHKANTGSCASRPLWCAAEDTLRWAAFGAKPQGRRGLASFTVEGGAEQNPRRTGETVFPLLTQDVISFSLC